MLRDDVTERGGAIGYTVLNKKKNKADRKGADPYGSYEYQSGNL